MQPELQQDTPTIEPRKMMFNDVRPDLAESAGVVQTPQNQWASLHPVFVRSLFWWVFCLLVRWVFAPSSRSRARSAWRSWRSPSLRACGSTSQERGREQSIRSRHHLSTWPSGTHIIKHSICLETRVEVGPLVILEDFKHVVGVGGHLKSFNDIK